MEGRGADAGKKELPIKDVSKNGLDEEPSPTGADTVSLERGLYGCPDKEKIDEDDDDVKDDDDDEKRSNGWLNGC